MSMPMRQHWMLLLWVFHWSIGSAQTAPLKVAQAYENGLWQIESSAFECRLFQVLDGVANISFVRRPGEPVSLQLQLLSTEQPFNRAYVVARRADWQPNNAVSAISASEQGQIDQFKAVFVQDAGRFISLLPHGYWLDFTLEVGHSPMQLTLTSIEGMSALKNYEHCKGAMSPLSWDQARHYEIDFATAQQVVNSDKVLTHLRDLVRYVELDHTVSKVLVDGHTDDVGNAAANRALSQRRADEVASRLQEFGMEPTIMEVRAHGSRYPIVNNNSDEKGLNRRVSIRLIKHQSKKEV